jgi:hypothetical protein
MTKRWLIPFFMAGLLGDKAFADCLPAHDTPASVIEYFQRFNKPLPEQFCAKEAAPQASHEPPQESSQTEEAPGQYGDDDGPGDGPFAQYEGDPGGGYESDQGGGYERDQGGGYERDQGGGYERDQEGGYEGDQEGGCQDAWNHDSDGYWKNDDKGHKGGKHRKGDDKQGNAMASANSRVKKPT